MQKFFLLSTVQFYWKTNYKLFKTFYCMCNIFFFKIIILLYKKRVTIENLITGQNMMNFIYVSIDSLNRRHLFQTSFMMFTLTHLHTVNQLLFATNLFRELSEINWFAVTNLGDQSLSTPIFYYNIIINTGSRQEIFATIRLSQTSRKFLVRE